MTCGTLRFPFNRMRLLLPILAVFALCPCYGVTWKGSMRRTVNLSIDTPAPHTVQVWGYPATNRIPDSAVYYSLGVNLREARPFFFTFPDGHAANSKQIDAALLAKHLAPVTKGDKGRTSSQISFVKGRENYHIIFDVGRNGLAEHLSLYSCKHTLRKVLGTADGTRVFDFPLKQSEIADLFGGPLRIGHDFAILGCECD